MIQEHSGQELRPLRVPSRPALVAMTMKDGGRRPPAANDNKNNSYNQNNHHNPQSDHNVSAPHSSTLASTSHIMAAHRGKSLTAHMGGVPPTVQSGSPTARFPPPPPHYGPKMLSPPPPANERELQLSLDRQSQSRCVPGGSVGVTSICCRSSQHIYRSPSPSGFVAVDDFESDTCR